MHIVILGAGLVGVASAYYLAKDGHKVTVLDRQPGPARETSYATTCLLTPGHSVAWTSPRAPLQLLSSIFQKDSPLVFRPHINKQLFKWGLRFLSQCTEKGYRTNTLAQHFLAKYSLQEITRLSKEHNFQWDNLSQGVLYLERDAKALEKAEADLALLAEAGVTIERLSRDQLLAIDPVYARSKIHFAGALRIPSDQSGDGHKFANNLAKLCKTMGVEFRYNVSIQSLARKGNAISHVVTNQGDIQADAYVLSLGSYSPMIAATIKLDLPIYPVKGYSMTLPVTDSNYAPKIGGVDSGSFVAFSRLGDRLRITTTAEIAGYDTSYQPKNFSKLHRIAQELFQGGVDFSKISYWACLRPASADGPPIIGNTPLSNLWLNTGHGYLGWTMSCGSGKLLSNLIAKRPTSLDPMPYRFGRF